ncbi:hypothetical protein M5K25_018427 [Dendrobium thyrsiflorum]|uniref:Uncharacterized protein n=1 Tax=Dendrobium thyrsiflorum TaxID=117978 RepID=A0ABD0UI75_DENTH
MSPPTRYRGTVLLGTKRNRTVLPSVPLNDLHEAGLEELNTCMGGLKHVLISAVPAPDSKDLASRVCLSSSLFVVDVRLRCFAVDVEIARIASSALFDFTPSTTFPSCRIGSYDILIGSNNGSSLAVKITFYLSRASSAKSRVYLACKYVVRRIKSLLPNLQVNRSVVLWIICYFMQIHLLQHVVLKVYSIPMEQQTSDMHIFFRFSLLALTAWKRSQLEENKAAELKPQKKEVPELGHSHTVLFYLTLISVVFPIFVLHTCKLDARRHRGFVKGGSGPGSSMQREGSSVVRGGENCDMTRGLCSCGMQVAGSVKGRNRKYDGKLGVGCPPSIERGSAHGSMRGEWRERERTAMPEVEKAAQTELAMREAERQGCGGVQEDEGSPSKEARKIRKKRKKRK